MCNSRSVYNCTVIVDFNCREKIRFKDANTDTEAETKKASGKNAKCKSHIKTHLHRTTEKRKTNRTSAQNHKVPAAQYSNNNPGSQCCGKRNAFALRVAKLKNLNRSTY